MPRTILDYVGRKSSKINVSRFVELSYRIADTSVKAFFGLYELVQRSNDKKLKQEAKRLYGKNIVELAALFHELQKVNLVET